MMNQAESKHDIRQRILARRRQVGSEDQRRASRAVCRLVLDEVNPEQFETVMLYCPARDDYEIDPRSLFEIDEDVFSSASCFMPRIDTDEDTLDVFELPDPTNADDTSREEFYTVNHPDTPLEVVTFNVPEPIPDRSRKADPGDLDLVFVPGVAFDYDGNRIGFGSGYYDQLLARLPDDTLTVGLCYDFQLIDQCPTEEHDRSVDWVISESEAIEIDQ